MRDQRVQIILIIALFTILTGGFGFVSWPLGFKFTVRVFAVLLLLFLVFMAQFTERQHFRYFVLALAFLPFVSVLYSYGQYDQPLQDGIKGTLPSLLWLFYFVLHRFKVKEESFLKAIFCIAVFVVIVQIVQQFTYPNAWFGIRDEENLTSEGEIAENRNGIWRFNVGINGIFTAICLFFFWCKMLKRIRYDYLLVVALMFVSVYLTLTRQVIISVVLTLFLSFFIGRGSKKVWLIIVGAVILVILYMNFDILFGEFIQMAQQDNNKQYIRFLAANYFWRETFTSLQAAFFGHGDAVSGSFLALHDQLQEDYRFFISDVGFIGMMWKYGIFYVLLCYGLMLYAFLINKDKVPLYIRLFVLFSTIPSIMIFPMLSPISNIMWSFLLYFCDRHINRLNIARLLVLLLEKYKHLLPR
jgi:hypothetical protein